MRTTILAACILWVGMTAARAAALPDGGITAGEMADVMHAKNLPVELTSDRDGDPLIHTQADGVKFHVYFYECTAQKRCQSIQFYAGWTTKGLTTARMNEWNRTKRFGRAYLDRVSEPCVEMDVDLQHGATTQAVANDIDRWMLVMKTFRSFVGEAP